MALAASVQVYVVPDGAETGVPAKEVPLQIGKGVWSAIEAKAEGVTVNDFGHEIAAVAPVNVGPAQSLYKIIVPFIEADTPDGIEIGILTGEVILPLSGVMGISVTPEPAFQYIE